MPLMPQSRPPIIQRKAIAGALSMILALTMLNGCKNRDETYAQADTEAASATTPQHNKPVAKPAKSKIADGTGRPAMWKLSDADTHIFLFGGVHMLPKGVDWQTGWVNTVVDSADMLILELSPEEQAQAPQVLADLSSDGLDIPLEDRIPPQLTDELDILAGRARVSRAQLDGMESWAAALLLSNATSRNASLSLSNGTEAILTKRFKALGKPISGLETAQFQLSLFDRLPQRTQDALLAQTIGEANNAGTKTDALIKAWTSGDVDSIALYADGELRSVDGLARPLLTERNAQWAQWISDRMQQPGTILISVGAGHLVGEDSVQNMLTEKGYTVTRVQ